MWEGDYMSSALRKPTSTQIIASIGCIIVMGMNVSYQVVMTSFPYIMEAMQISKVEASMMSTVVSVGVVVMALIGTRLIDKLTPRWSMLVGTLLVTAFLVVNAIGLPYIAWVACGLLAGFGSALGSLGAASGLMRQYWGMDSGSKFTVIAGIQTLIVSGYTALMAWLWTFMDFQGAFWVIAALTLVLGGGANLICFRKPDAFVAEELAEAVKAQAIKDAEKPQEAASGWSFGESFKHSPIYLFTLAFVAAAVINGGITTFLTTFLTEAGMDKPMAALLQSYFTVICGVHMLYSGYFHKFFGNKIYFTFFFGLSGIGFICLSQWLGMAPAGIAFVVFALALVGAMKPIMTTAAVVVTQLFGNKDYVAYNSYSQAILNVGRLISSFTTASILQFLGAALMCYFFAGLAILSAVGFCIADAVSPWARIANEKRKATKAAKAAGKE